jgi:hypothetical protein
VTSAMTGYISPSSDPLIRNLHLVLSETGTKAFSFLHYALLFDFQNYNSKITLLVLLSGLKTAPETVHVWYSALKVV